ncbi:nitronate monooxygenase [Gordonia pseudamarae]|jgi:NAD(P)H-dependent flavin oxidoreductase YrpB (nitropropane dioxygenase family)|uniref:Nitronate monooxygenase n=1 Tax=Gordonia pseudamarae TaxID=2831662 RepID=A0ABX6IE72_9ACTN|nr:MULTISPECIES: nitronate monooxygenase [Gordonia]MBD0021472.1 nitronate monooxygenase [Gordonia sp. (in: high G+C Gram-positive bacteria)]QHN25225.1 nitronate monooxygenase [Gordonia pseudamarae]QHN34157.1 nitronate monooxygenase [Gordonia pseudamarae]
MTGASEAMGNEIARAAALPTKFTELVGIEYPIVQTGMGWVSGPSLTSATSNAGGLGILASATMTFGELESAIKKTKSLTDKPFGVNMRADAGDAADRIDLVIREGVKVASFALAPKKELIAKLKDHGVVVIPSIGAAKHALKVASWGADAVIVQGGEGGGHTGPVATTLLLPSVIDALAQAGSDMPVVASGGFFDGRGLVAALAYGADGIAMGTRFLLTSDSAVPDSVKQEYLKRSLNDTVVSTKVDGMPHRVLRTPLVDALESGSPVKALTAAARNANEFKQLTGMKWTALLRDGLAMKKSGERTWQQIIMAGNTPMLLRAGLVEGDTRAGVLASGQVVGMIDDLPSCEELIQSVMTQAYERRKALS